MSSKRAKTLADFIDTVNTRYEALHTAFEEQFWGTADRTCGSG